MLTISGRRRLQSGPDFLNAVAESIAATIGVPVNNVLVVQTSPTTLTVVVRVVTTEAATAAAAATGSETPAAAVDVAAITAAVSAPSFVSSVQSQVTSKGHTVTVQQISAPVTVVAVVTAPSPPPPKPPPEPPMPGLPAVTLFSSSKAYTGTPTDAGATPAEDSNMVASLVVGTVFAILLIICFPIATVLLVLWVRKKRKRIKEAQEAYFLSIVPEMVDAETQCSDAGSDDEEAGGFMTGLGLPAPGDTGAGVLALEAQGARSRVDNLMESTAGSVQSPGVHARIDSLMDTTTNSLAETTTGSVYQSPDAQHDRVVPPTATPGARASSPRGSVSLTL